MIGDKRSSLGLPGREQSNEEARPVVQTDRHRSPWIGAVPELSGQLFRGLPEEPIGDLTGVVHQHEAIAWDAGKAIKQGVHGISSPLIQWP